MDTLITYEEVVTLVANPPTLAPRPNFSNLCALRIHLQRALQQLVNPQRNVLEWSGLVMSRPMYLLISSNAFRIPNDPGPIPIYFGRGMPIVNDDGTAVVDSLGNPTYLPVNHVTQARINALLAILSESQTSMLKRAQSEH